MELQEFGMKSVCSHLAGVLDALDIPKVTVSRSVFRIPGNRVNVSLSFSWSNSPLACRSLDTTGAGLLCGDLVSTTLSAFTASLGNSSCRPHAWKYPRRKDDTINTSLSYPSSICTPFNPPATKFRTLEGKKRQAEFFLSSCK